MYTNKTALSPELCNDIILLYERDKCKYNGVTQQGHNKNIKNTIDLTIPFMHDNSCINNNYTDEEYNELKKVMSCIHNELTRNVSKYIKEINTHLDIGEENSHVKYSAISSSLSTTKLLIQKYKQNNGRYVYHTDDSIEWESKKHRVVTFLFYLNTVEEGGETEFWGGDVRIKPEVGKLLLFPACWTYPHRGMIPKSSDKYIATGWLYANN
jgi:hypothetical protein